jgi:peroxiredoxin
MIRTASSLLLILALACSGCAGSRSGSRNSAVGGIALMDLKGRQVQLQDFRGKVVLLSFWGSHCDPCHLELPLLQDLWKRHRDRGFELISINVDGTDAESTVRQVVRRYRYTFPVLLDQETEVVSRFNPKLDLPYNVLLDKDGRVVFVHQGYRTGDEAKMEREVLKLFSR